MQQITSKDNAWIKEYGKLASSKGARDRTGRFVLESVKLFREAVQSGLSIEMVFVTETCFCKQEQELEKLFQGLRVCQIPSVLEKKLSQAQTPQGVYAIAQKLDKSFSLDKIETSGRYLVLVGLQDAGNVGTMIRTAEALGVEGVILADHTCDIYNPKVIRGSMGSVFRMPFYQVDEAGILLEELRRRQVSTYAAVLDPDAALLGKLAFDDPAVLLIGNEGNGLPPELAAKCTQRVTIPMSGNTESLNASMAACILLWEMTK